MHTFAQHGALGAEFIILCHGNRVPAAQTAQQRSGNGKAASVHQRGEVQRAARTIVETVQHPVADRITAGDRALFGILAVAETLRHLCAAHQRIVHTRQELAVHQIVRIKNAHGIELLRQHDFIHHLGEHLALAADDALRTENARAAPGSHCLGVVGAVVGRDDHLIQLAGIILPIQAVHQMADHRRLVACRHHKCKAFFRLRLGRRRQFFAQAEQCDHTEINGVQAKRDAQHKNDPCQNQSHHLGFISFKGPKPGKFRVFFIPCL